MLPTLQWYIFREMGGTFLLTAVGMTIVLGLGGGVLELVEIEQVSAEQLLRLMFIVVPVAGTLTLPIAALYSATVTYGRLSADNEFLACKSSGINVAWLFIPTLVISLVSAGCTLYFTCFMIPGLVKDLNALARANVREIIESRLTSPGRLPLPQGNARIYADGQVDAVGEEGVLALRGVAFTETDEKGWLRYGSAGLVALRFGEEDGAATISGKLEDFSYYERDRGLLKAASQDIPSKRIPRPHGLRLKWLNLSELFQYHAEPQRWPKVESAVARTRFALLKESLYDWFFVGLSREGREGEIEMSGGGIRWKVAVQSATRDAYDGRVTMEDVRVEEWAAGRVRTITGRHAVLMVAEPEEGSAPTAFLDITGDVVVTDASEAGGSISKGRENIRDIPIPQGLIDDVEAIPATALLKPLSDRPMRQASMELNTKAVAEGEEFLRNITSELHSRLAFSASAFVVVILGAILGVMYRGAHPQVAFAISFVPALFVIVMNIMGRQLAEKEGAVTFGLAVIWGAIILVGLIDLSALRRVVRR
jgi:lipopolysaccharide export LptBFGC system permease protein LptF